MRKKILAGLTILGTLTLLTLTMTFAGKNGQAGKSNIGHLYLYEKVPSGEWPIVEGGAWGKMKYNLAGSTFDFVFNGHGLSPNTDFRLIHYKDPWPGGPDRCALIGSGRTNALGDIHLGGSVDLGMDLDAKIWLVLSGDYNPATKKMNSPWHPTEALLEYNTMSVLGASYDDTDVP